MKEEMKAREKRLNAILKNHGICVEWIESVKNNQTLDGYVIKKEGESLSPILYYTILKLFFLYFVIIFQDFYD